MILSFECDVSDRLKTALENYIHPKNSVLSATDDLFIENKVYYFGKMVLIVQRSLFDLIAQYIAYFGIIGLVFSVLIGGVTLWGKTFFISLLLIAAAMSYLFPKVRFYLLRWRIHKVIDRDLRMDWLSKEQVVSRFVKLCEDEKRGSD